MAYARIPARPRNVDHAQLEDALFNEFRSPSEGTQPLIFWEGPRPDAPTRLFVVWDAWVGVSPQTRSEITLNAFQRQYGDEKALQVSIAMGLTMEDAKRMGIPT